MRAPYVKNKGLKCSIEGCDNQSSFKRLCNKHYKRVQKYGDPHVCKLERNKGKLCKVEGCGKAAFSKLYCMQHYDSVFKHGREYLILASRGSGYVTKDGYREYTINGQKVLEHVALVEKALGKPLPPGAVVHHMNENKLDNFTPFNLIVCPDQTYHMLLHARMRQYEKYGKCLDIADL